MKKDELAILEVGMYVRFKDKRGSHYIRKITSVNTEYPGKLYAGIYIDKTANNCNGVSLKNIIKVGHRLIDLIDKGDYVNGYKVSFKGNDYKPFVQCDYPVQEGKTNHYRFYENEIYSIVTKEQFNSTKYVVGEQE